MEAHQFRFRSLCDPCGESHATLRLMTHAYKKDWIGHGPKVYSNMSLHTRRQQAAQKKIYGPKRVHRLRRLNEYVQVPMD